MKQYKVRSMVRAAPGKILISADLSQAESWIVAFLANEPNMKHSLQFSDIHTDTAAALFFENNIDTHVWEKLPNDIRKCKVCGCEITKVTRYIGKRCNHASAYRMKPPRMAEVINKDSDKPPYVTVTIKETKRYAEAWHRRYAIKPWWMDIERKLDYSRSLTTPYGRQRTFFAAWGDELFKEATAFVPQSTVADHFNGRVQKELGIKGGLVEIRRQLVLPYADHAIVNQSHDSCILEVPISIGTEIAIRCKQLLKRPLVINNEEFTIPVDAEMGEYWGEGMEPIKEAA